ncbi:MAG: Rieske (2Fe-2S) protein [Candidatus Nanopelagicales bacterium]|jgi:Rieske Fe-S protein|nr:Rieske (2Fe-2S) protein [Candidatus Nanopelagicales bacterium]MCU0298805.1 Rieske (2Fe-2S) protein [Candidatus Nanopelagicales bacterium]
MADLTRRNVLTAGTIGVAGVALVGCSSGDDTATTPTAGTSAAPATSPAQTGQEVTAVSDVPVDGGIIVDSGDTKMVVTQPTAGEYVGLSAVCPHQGCLVNQIENQVIVCPCHGSQFSIVDGSVVQGPATTGLESIPVEVAGDQIVLG